ncbi:MAG: hypothetical protein KIT14_13975 [bacterium]|nr:hypothetical protein [bacterium]MCW5891640.1 hypothetical protein [bacterium]
MRRALAVLGTDRLDGRSAIAQAARRFKLDLVRDLGGDPSAQQLAIIEVAARTMLLLSSVDDWIMRQPSLVNARKKALLPAVRERQQLADSLARMLGQLGLARKAAPVESLDAYLARRAAETAAQNAQNPG